MRLIHRAEGERYAGHKCLVDGRDQERRATAAAWVCEGLARGERVVHLEADEPVMLMEALHEGGIDGERSLAAGQLVLLSPAEVFRSGGVVGLAHACAAQVTAVRHAREEGYPAIRLSADSLSVLEVIDEEDLRHFEAWLDRFCQEERVSALCLYDEKRVAGRLGNLVASHPGGLADPILEVSRADGALRLRGEIDASNHALLAAILDACSDRGGPVLDLAGVTFVDLGGVRLVVEAARRQTSGRMRVVGSACVRSVLGMLAPGELDLCLEPRS